MLAKCLVLSLCAAVGFVAQARADDQFVRAHYIGYAAALPIFEVDLTESLKASSYRLQTSFQLTGVLGAIFHANGTTTVDGRFDGARAFPREAFSVGRFGGTQHVLQLDWQSGSPKIIQMAPPVEEDREPVPASEQSGTIDTLSAIALLLHQASETGRCENTTRTFDGVRLSEFASQTAGTMSLEPTGRSTFQGPALRCDVTGRMIGGFTRDSDRAELMKPKHASAWLARLGPGQPLVPVRIAIYPEASPTVTLYLDQPQPKTQ